MSKKFSATARFEINADPPAVWKGLTDPAMVKQYFFGTNLATDWKKGSPIYFRGEWEGKPYEDKGTILNILPGKHIKYSYWSSMSGTPDIPENYATISYDLTKEGASTVLTITQDGIDTAERKNHSEETWKHVMEGLKKLVEGK